MHLSSKVLAEDLDIFRSNLPNKFIYIPNPGNAGDSLIAAATYQVFDTLNFDYTVQLTPENLKDKTVVLGGGGNLIPLYKEMHGFISAALEQGASRIILLPHTVRGNEELLYRLRSNDLIFSRDKRTTEYLKQYGNFQVKEAFDMALVFSASLFWEKQKEYRDLARVFAKIFAENNTLYHFIGSQGNFFRTDGEATDMVIPSDNVDLSLLFQFGVQPDNAEKSVACLMKVLSTCETVHTNRLHVGVAAAHLGKKVTLFDNNYGKNHGVIELTPRVFSNLHIA